jgi:hypothetical protein
MNSNGMKQKPHIFEDNRDRPLLDAAEIKAAMQQLDGKNKTVVAITFENLDSLTVEMKNDGRYICYITEAQSFYSLKTQNRLEVKKADAVPGGPWVNGTPDYVTFGEALQAAEYYAEHGAQDPTLEWEEQ